MTQHKHRIRIRIFRFSREFETLSEFTGRKWSVVRYETYEIVRKSSTNDQTLSERPSSYDYSYNSIVRF